MKVNDTDLIQEKPFRRPQIVRTRDLRVPNQYTLGLEGEYREWAYNEERAPENRGRWREHIFHVSPETPVDVEVGTGNGIHFRERLRSHPERCLVGLELKFKPLIQTVRGMLRTPQRNGRVCRVHAFNIDTLFEAGEVDDIFMHFPDPWTSPRKPKNRMINGRMARVFWSLQKPGARFELKTDSQEFYDWALEHMSAVDYRPLLQSRDWHRDSRSQGAVRTQFENIFTRQGLPIYYSLWRRR